MSFSIKYATYRSYFITATAIRILSTDWSQSTAFKLEANLRTLPDILLQSHFDSFKCYSSSILKIASSSTAQKQTFNSSAESNSLTMPTFYWNTAGRFSSHTPPQLKSKSIFNYSNKYKSTWKPIPDSLHSQPFIQTHIEQTSLVISPESKNHRGIATIVSFRISI